ncbi:MAG: DsbA family protein [Vicinamibacterales bacterium]
MTRNRLLTVMVALTLVMQAAILYRTPARRPAPPPTTDAPQNVYFDLVDFPVKGSAQAKAVIVEFSDYECPFCARHATTVLPELMKRFVDGGLVRYALANNPLPMHPNADWLARMASCAGEQGRYWDIHHGLFASKPASHPAAIALADPLDLDRSRLQD